MDAPTEDIARAVLDRHGTHLRRRAPASGSTDQPAPLFQLLVLAQLLSARIGAGIAVATAAGAAREPAGRPRSACATPPGRRDRRARPGRLPPLRRAHRHAAAGHGAARPRPVRRRSAPAGRGGGRGRRAGGRAASRRSRASGRPAPRSSCARSRRSGRGCAPTWTTGRVRGARRLGLPDDAGAAGRPGRRPTSSRGSPRDWCASRCCRARTR